MMTIYKADLRQFVPCFALRFFALLTLGFINGRKHKVYIKYNEDRSKIAEDIIPYLELNCAI